MSKIYLFVHGKAGNAKEAELYQKLTNNDVFGLEYNPNEPWNVKEIILNKYEELKKQYDSVEIIAHSIGAWFSMIALQNTDIQKSFFVSPVVDMEKLVKRMMMAFGITEEMLKEKGEIPTPLGENLSWKYLEYIKANPINWNVETTIIYGTKDNLIPMEDVKEFSEKTNANYYVLENGEHWFHTEEQLAFLSNKFISFDK